MYMAGR